MRVGAVLVLLELCSAVWQMRRAGSDECAGWVTTMGNLARGRDRVPGKSRNREVELGGYHARKLQWLRPRLGRSGVRCLAEWPSGLMKGDARDQRGHGTGWGEGVVSGSQGRRSKLPVTSLGRELAGGHLGPAGAPHWPVQRPLWGWAGVMAGDCESWEVAIDDW